MSQARPRALMIAPAMPASAGNGLAMRLGLFLEAFASFADTDLVVIPLVGPADAPPALPQRLGVETMIIPAAGRADTAYQLLTRLRDPQERLTAFRRYGRTTLAAHLSVPVLDDLRSALKGRRYDFIHVARAYMAQAALALPRPACRTLDLDEDDASTWRSIATATADPAWWHAEAHAADRQLFELGASFDAVFASSPLECAGIHRRHPGLSPRPIANAVALPRPQRRRDDGGTLLFVGSFGYTPNVDAALWFADRVWPRLRRHASRLVIAGRNMPPALRALARRRGVSLRADLPDLSQVYARATVAIAPLRSGGGTRIKLLEAAARGVPIVATSLAAAGLALDRRRAWIADGAERFAAALRQALSRRGQRRRRAQFALAYVRRRHDRAAAARGLACQLQAMAAH